ncbi:TetR/AcrR family transcriptional regulator [Pyxidicoccus parkwayensis]|uniref:TetR/AcrR family transcriptional regulator n=1 Tax=Pyxidicoccus parkwayensis TaxID=2813578 RepID=UPI003530C1A9
MSPRQPVAEGVGRGWGMWMQDSAHADAMHGMAKVLAARGYDNVQSWELARVIGSSVGTLYRRYGNKEGISLAVRDFTEECLSEQARLAFECTRQEPDTDFRDAFHAWWRELAWWTIERRALFAFTFMHWHPRAHTPDTHPPFWPAYPGAIIRSQSYGGATRTLVREVLEVGEREGVFAPGCGRIGEGLIWGALMELARSANENAQVGEADVLASATALWRALIRTDDSGPRGAGTLPPATKEPSSGDMSGPAAAETSLPREMTVASAPPGAEPAARFVATEPRASRLNEAAGVPHAETESELATGCRTRSTLRRSAFTGPRAVQARAGAARFTGRPRTRTARRRSARDCDHASGPPSLTSPRAHPPPHPVEQAECPDRARRSPLCAARRSLLHTCNSARGCCCSRCCWQQEPERNPPTVAEMGSWPRLELGPTRACPRSRAFLLPKTRAPPPEPSSRARDCPVPCATSPPPRW